MTIKWVSAFWLPLLAIAPAKAEAPPTPLEEVVVTADLRPLPSTRRPGGATVIAQSDIRDAAVVHLEELLPQVPSLSWAGASSRPRYFQLRGVGELEQYQGAPNPSVGFLVDEIDFSAIGMIATLFDVEQVEVLRGPQGTRYGANALGGLIKLKTREPEARESVDIEAGFGDDGLWTAGAVAGGALPLTELTGAWRAVLHHAASDGFRDNRHLDRADTNARDETQARVRIRLAAEGRWQADLGILHADFDNGYDAFAIDNSFHTLSDRPGQDAQRSEGAFLDVNGSLGALLDWRSITTWADSDIVASFDGDWGNDVDWGDAGPYDFFSQTLRGRRALSQDLRLSADAGRWAWIAGAWRSQLTETNHVTDAGRYLDDAFVVELESRYRATSTALYGQLQWRPREDTTLAAGLRVETRDADYRDSAGVAFDPGDTLWGGELTATRRLGAAHSVWATVARGFRAGGFNIGPSVPPERTEFDPEYLWSAEAGWKARNVSGNRSGDLNVFYTRREHQQVATSLQLDPENPLTFLFLTENAARGESWGIESSAALQATAAISFDAMLSWMESRFIGYFNGERDLDGRAFAHAPVWKAALGATWRHPEGWMARLDLSGEAGFYFDTSHDQRADSRFLANVRAGYEAERWSVQVWVRNLFDERYPVRGFFFENEPPDFPTRLYLRWGDPRQVGVTLRYTF
jgi:outer membrane receptor protein involved in Fe transport